MLRHRKVRIRRPRLSHEDCRAIAKEMVAGKPRKAIADDWKVSHALLCKIFHSYVTVIYVERFPDTPEQLDLKLPLTRQSLYGGSGDV